MIYRDPRSGQTQDVAERETVRRQLLEQTGWVIADDAPPAPALPDRVLVKLNDEVVIVDAGSLPVARPGYKLVDVTANDSQMAEFIEVPDDVPASKRKRSK